MNTVRLYDASREPASWLKIIQPTEFAAFATLADSGAVCDADGVRTSSDDASCVIFATLPDADAFCRARVEANPALRFDILDAAGHLKPPIMTIVHASKEAALDTSAQKIQRRRLIAFGLLASGPVLVWFDWTYFDGVQVLPTIVGINFVLIAIRLLLINYSVASSEREREARVTTARTADPRRST